MFTKKSTGVELMKKKIGRGAWKPAGISILRTAKVIQRLPGNVCLNKLYKIFN